MLKSIEQNEDEENDIDSLSIIFERIRIQGGIILIRDSSEIDIEGEVDKRMVSIFEANFVIDSLGKMTQTI